MKLSLRVRNLQTGELGTVDFEEEANATVWLRARPRFVEVLGMASDEVPHETSMALRAAMRPLDAEEAKLEAEIVATQRAAIEKLARDRVEREKRESAAQAGMAGNLDPNRAMEISWTYDHGMVKGDAADTREISEEARAAAMAWIDERMEWVRDRKQIVGSAKVTVYPAVLPKAAGGERVQKGTFIPCAAPEPNEKMN